MERLTDLIMRVSIAAALSAGAFFLGFVALWYYNNAGFNPMVMRHWQILYAWVLTNGVPTHFWFGLGIPTLITVGAFSWALLVGPIRRIIEDGIEMPSFSGLRQRMATAAVARAAAATPAEVPEAVRTASAEVAQNAPVETSGTSAEPDQADLSSQNSGLERVVEDPVRTVSPVSVEPGVVQAQPVSTSPQPEYIPPQIVEIMERVASEKDDLSKSSTLGNPGGLAGLSGLGGLGGLGKVYDGPQAEPVDIELPLPAVDDEMWFQPEFEYLLDGEPSEPGYVGGVGDDVAVGKVSSEDILDVDALMMGMAESAPQQGVQVALGRDADAIVEWRDDAVVDEDAAAATVGNVETVAGDGSDEADWSDDDELRRQMEAYERGELFAEDEQDGAPPVYSEFDFTEIADPDADRGDDERDAEGENEGGRR